MGGDVGDSIRELFADDQAEETPATRQRPDRRAFVGRHPAGYEPLDPILGPNDPEGGVLGPNERPDPFDDQLEGLLDVEQPGDRTGRLVHRVERGRIERLGTRALGVRGRSHRASLAAFTLGGLLIGRDVRPPGKGRPARVGGRSVA